MTKRKPKLQYRYYEMEPNSQVLALLGDEWKRPYGQGIEGLHFHNFMEIGICYEGHGTCILRDQEYVFEGGYFSLYRRTIRTRTIPIRERLRSGNGCILISKALCRI